MKYWYPSRTGSQDSLLTRRRGGIVVCRRGVNNLTGITEEAFATNCWSVVAASGSVSSTAAFATMLAGKPIVLFRDNTGAVVALEDRCVHRHAPLSLGKVESQGLRCRYHGLLFAPDGKCLHIPGQTFIPPNACVTTYPVLERHGWIWVWPGDPRPATETVPPTAIARDH